MSQRPVMIYHVPFPLNPAATSASGIRPVRMRRAFEANGYEVFEVSGRHPERREQMRALRKRISSGLKVEFVYSEASTTPTGLGEKITPATSLTRDVAFLRFCRKAGVPVGLFYRDIYWQFEEYAERVGQPYTAILRWRYRADLRGYRQGVDKIYLPSMRMAAYLPIENQPQALALPPGAERFDSPSPSTGISLFYVGGTGGYYRMQETVRGVGMSPGARLTICTREGEWAESAPLYADVLNDSTTVVYKSGSELEGLYADAHIGVLLMEPLEYREFAAPMKLYEYLGHGKPIVATQGSLAGDFVEENGIGWAISYGAEPLAELLSRLQAHPEELAAAQQRAREVRQQHTWEARARQVATDLTER
ncbi:glycosyl transferase family 1 [Salinibacterium sp. UTAS2018]|uniref:glycosyltransferase n=1 Tax=Salinibacterium sp. UTAS2018 TaxID=2508880 RepID=UPI00100950F5|nr:glycosyltransferase [Salinibacterium sp. UTAS2018]QAV69980.1 glycosyl transferase family 1 [Salinibacterium sp. UTAS2018]